MTRYLDVDDISHLVRHIGFDKVLIGLAAYVATDYKRWHEMEKWARLVRHSPIGVNELMPCSDKDLFGFKYVNGHPANTAKGLMTVVAFGMLADIETGYPQLLSELTLGTALRTAATSAVAAQVLARPNSRVMAVIGCGSQCEFQILAFSALLGIKEFRVFDIDAQAIAKVQRNLSAYNDIRILAASSTREAVIGADIITTITADKNKATILTPDMIEPGMHINGVGGDCPGKTEIHPAILQNAHVVVEYEPQTRIEGDIQQMPADFAVTELWEVLTNPARARHSAGEITVFDSVGFALEDFSVLRYFNDMAKQHDIGRTINLVPSLADPKDLFGLLQTVSMPVPPALKVANLVERK